MNKISFKSVFTPFFVLIFSAMFLSTLSEQIITRKVEALVSSKDGLSNMIWAWGTASILSAIFFPLLFAMLSSYNIIKIDKKPKASDFFAEHFELSIIETMRAWGKSFLWSFLLIFPGIWKLILYIFTPYVVLFSKRYARGEVDALEYSTQICKQNIKAVNWWLTVFYFFLPVTFFLAADQYTLIHRHPLAATVLVLIHTLAEYVFHYIMLKMFVEFINKNENTVASAT